MSISRLNPFNLLVLGLYVFFGGTLLAVAGIGTLGWLLLRFAAALMFFFAAYIGFVRGEMRPQGVRYYKAFLWLLLYLTILTVPNLRGTWGYLGFRAALAGDVITYGLFAFGLALFALNGAEIIRLFKIFAALCFALFVILLPFLDPGAVGEAGSRQEALQIAGLAEGRNVYNFQMALAAIFPYIFLSNFALHLSARWRFIVYLMPAFVLLIALYYSKRATMLDLGVSIGLFFIFIAPFANYFAGVKKIRVFVITGLVGCVLLLAAFIFGNHLAIVVDRLVGRVEELRYSLSELDRLLELQLYWGTLPDRMKFTGAGSMHFHSVKAVPSDTVHIGWANLYNKGGPPLVVFVFYILAKNFFTSLRHRRNPSFAVGATLPVLLGISLCHSTIFGSLHSSFAFTLALFLYPAIKSLEDSGRLPLLRRPAGNRNWPPSRIPPSP